MPEISQAMIGALQEAMAQLTAAVSSLTATASVILANKADKAELIQQKTDIKSMIDDLKSEIIK